METETMDASFYMRLALQMAEAARGQTGVNPVVGCVVVKQGRIVGIGTHLKRGTEHAEVHAIRMAGGEAEGSTVYVTLEPCSYYGRTPPCADLLIQSKVAKVVVACLDPNPQVAGKGIEKLRSRGIEVETGVLQEEAAALNEPFNKYIVSGLPFVTLKTACTLDGKIASRTGDSKWITNEKSRAFVHVLRHRHQAIMVGSGTVLADDPSLTTRLEVEALQPIRIVVDSMLRSPENAKIFDGQSRTIVLTTDEAPRDKAERLTGKGVEVVATGQGPHVDLRMAMKLLGEREIGSILLEGGGRLNGAMLENRLVDVCRLFFAPKIIGGREAPGSFAFEGFERMSDALKLERIRVESFGDDVCITGYPVYGPY
ncbi:bifunctional diaminohydroxyphosphoribosylaminopyrimidine deaminase/5-amino-6-(5-phosphoribosylamino)uracil reductase RibD [Paenibacillus contaminans]|uniref:Riboflavin biosynthesis protein RibD n=1 Tax=Paenibacillus contaminans TaxID=450362 RepID=A0A329MF47_9BACL|nr:bifunctional diaminohydroxyphosphoribosylaminopyrimidine deaminase/5-amino-6-(5-phosphoribosylamino)uracil reductase RibD [Paenibacillus contaminans]RAV18579.1 bifunctional diaminohydroxyphosphoribosylaminopyrimidine deaminase/5-amino-6-(5-phosphoribosylamino)uracil reductase RibD [Paenibacillus contaminans]